MKTFKEFVKDKAVDEQSQNDALFKQIDESIADEFERTVRKLMVTHAKLLERLKDA